MVKQDKRVVSNVAIPFEASSVSVNPDTMDVAVGGDDCKVHIYSLSGTALNPKTEIVHLGPITDCAYSPDRKYLVACDANRKVICTSVEEYKVSKVNTLSDLIITFFCISDHDFHLICLESDGKLSFCMDDSLLESCSNNRFHFLEKILKVFLVFLS